MLTAHQLRALAYIAANPGCHTDRADIGQRTALALDKAGLVTMKSEVRTRAVNNRSRSFVESVASLTDAGRAVLS